MVHDKGELEAVIASAVKAGVLLDKRAEMPKGPGTWPERKPSQILGQCIHQNGSANFTKPIRTAEYHTSPGEHLTRASMGVPSTVYPIMIPDLDTPAWLTAELLDRTYAQGKRDSEGYPGDENLHLVGVLVMGGYRAPGYRGYRGAPSQRQMTNLYRVTEWLQTTFGYGDEGLFYHAHFGKAGCPGYALMDWVEERREGAADLRTDREWQEALLRWHHCCLPKYGADGHWGNESRRALVKFQAAMGLRVTGLQDPFTELLLLRGYPLLAEQG